MIKGEGREAEREEEKESGRIVEATGGSEWERVKDIYQRNIIGGEKRKRQSAEVDGKGGGERDRERETEMERTTTTSKEKNMSAPCMP